MFKITTTTNGFFNFMEKHYIKISLVMIGGCAIFSGYFYRTVYKAHLQKRLNN